MNCFVFFILHKIRCIFCSRCLLELKGVRNDVKWSGFYFALIWSRKYKNYEESIFLVFFSTHFFLFWQRKICNDHFHMSKLIPLFENIVVQGDMNSSKGDTSIFMYSKYSLLWIVIFPFPPLMNSTDIKT